MAIVNRWTARDVFMILFMIVLAVLTIMEMIQNDRLYEQITEVKHLLRSGRVTVPAPAGAASSRAASRPAAAETGQARVPGDWLVRSITEPESLNPILASDAYEAIVNSYIYETLIERDNATLKFVPRVAKRWQISEDKRHYRFWLDERARWQDGEPLTAEDVLFTYRTIMNPQVNCPHLKVYYQDIEDCRVLDTYTVEFTYKKLYWRALAFCGGMPILPRHIFAFSDAAEFNQHPRNRAPFGSGPYRFVRWDPGSQIILERNERYWRTEKTPAIERIVFKIFTNDTARFQALRGRELDMAPLTAEQWVRQTTDPEFARTFRRLKYLSNGYTYIGWNMRRPFFRDRRCRLAMTHLTPRKLLLEKVQYGLGVIVTGNFNIKTAAYNKSIQPWPYDPDRARQLLDEAGWTDHDGDGIRDKDGQPFSFELLIPSGRDWARKLASILAQECAKVGIQMRTNLLEWAVFLERIDRREFDAVTLGWSIGLDADPYQVWHSSQVKPPGHNFVGFVNAECDRIIEAARVEFDEEKRNRMFHRFHEIIHQEQPYTFLVCSYALVAVDRRFRGVRVYPLGLDPEEWWVPKHLQRYP